MKTKFKNNVQNTARQKMLMEKGKSSIMFYKAVFIYMLGGLVGTLWETVLNLCRGRGFVFCNGSILTPFNVVYGIGGLVIIACLRNQEKWWEVFLIGSFGGGAVEYMLNFLEEKILGTRSWNYDGKFLNINGRTTLVYMVVWGILCVVVIFLVYRPLDEWFGFVNFEILKIIAIISVTIIVIDWLVTVSALIRYARRNAGAEAVTYVEKLLDKVCGDSFMKRRFPNMRFV